MSVAASPDGGGIAVGTGAVEATVAVMDQAIGAELGRLKGHRAWIGRLVFFQGGQILASASADQTIRLWDPNRMAPSRPSLPDRIRTLPIFGKARRRLGLPASREPKASGRHFRAQSRPVSA